MIRELKRRIRAAAAETRPIDKLFFREISYSQEGEDRLLLRYFNHKPDGFYVDVGAHHPLRFSNTQIFYEMGWRGINIDALPGSMGRFRRRRPRDFNVEVGVGEEPGVAKFYVFNEPGVNTFNAEVAAKQNRPPWRIERVIDVPVRPLREIVAELLPVGRTIDFLTIDVEGKDLEVLRSNDWDRFRPQVVLAESVGKDLTGLDSDPTALYLGSLGYVPYAKTVNTFFFTDARRVD